MRVIVDIVDDQCDFIKRGFALPVGSNGEGAEEIVEPTNLFLSKLKPGTVDCVLFKHDTHFLEEYPNSPEAQAFPNIHCKYGTEGWKLAVDPEKISPAIPVYYMTKNTFDMWESNPLRTDPDFRNPQTAQAYANLYKVTADPNCLEPGIHRDEFLKDVGSETEVIMAGVASNFCDADAMYGYLKRAAKVTVLKDLVKGITLGPEGRAGLMQATGIDRTEGGTIEEVCRTERFRSFFENGQLRLDTSENVLARLQQKPPAHDAIGCGPA